MWRNIGTINFWGLKAVEDWQEFSTGLQLSESTLKIEFFNITEPLEFRYLLRRKFSDTSGRKIVEKADFFYPSSQPQIISNPIPQSYLQSMMYYKIEVRKYLNWRYRYIYPDPQVQMNIQSWQQE